LWTFNPSNCPPANKIVTLLEIKTPQNVNRMKFRDCHSILDVGVASRSRISDIRWLQSIAILDVDRDSNDFVTVFATILDRAVDDLGLVELIENTLGDESRISPTSFVRYPPPSVESVIEARANVDPEDVVARGCPDPVQWILSI
jgi:hypothetical protein